MERIGIVSDALDAAVAIRGAELCSLCNPAGEEFLWQAAPIWPRHAPNLFPIVGRLAGDTLRHRGETYRMPQHGFVRDRDFAVTIREASRCRLELADDAESRAIYPFAFRLAIDYAASGASLQIGYAVSNPGTETLPVSLGAHPGFAWPLRPGLEKAAHRMVFDRDEPEDVRQLRDGLILPGGAPSPVRGRSLALTPSLFDADALIFAPVNSRTLRYEAPAGPSLTVAWEGFSDLGIWSRRGGDFVCIEPWQGFASPAGFDGEFSEKPGLMHLAPGETRRLALTITLG